MRTTPVPWRRVAVGICAVALVTTGAVVAIRSDGFTAVDATAPRATRWFANQADGWVMLADGFSGTALARLQVDNEGQEIEVAQSSAGAAVYDTTGIARPIDTAALRFGPEQALGVDRDVDTVVAMTQPGLVAANPAAAEAVLLPPDGEPVRFQFGEPGSVAPTLVATDGAVWTLAGGEFRRVTTNGPDVFADDLAADARLTLVGNTGFVFDASANRARLADGGWVGLPAGLEATEVVLQETGPTNDCGWLASGDDLWCVGTGGIAHTVEVPGLNAGGSDQLAIAGDAAVLVDRSDGQIRMFDWRAGELITDRTIDGLTPGAASTVSTNVDLVWVDEDEGDRVWAIHPWGFHMISKRDATTPLLGEAGETL